MNENCSRNESCTRTKYYYDAACLSTPASPGDMTERVDNAGNITCYAYDALHRLTDAGYSGPVCRRFRYDSQTPPAGVVVTNTLARLAEAFTDNCSGQKLTDEWFSYDADGRTTDAYQWSTNSGGYYHSTAQYWPNGAV